MEISVMYPAAGERLCRHIIGGLWEYASIGIVDGGGDGEGEEESLDPRNLTT